MANATMTFTGPADGQGSVTLSHTGTTPDTIIPQFFAYYRTVYGNYYDGGKVTTQPKATDGSDNPVATDAQIYEAFAQGVAAGVADNVTRYMIEQAKAQAEAQVQAAVVTQTQ